MRRYLAMVLALLAAVLVVYVIGSAGSARHAKRTAAKATPLRQTTTSASSPTPAPRITTVGGGIRTGCRWRLYHDGAIGTDPACAAGAINSAVIGHTAQTICNRVWLAGATRLQPSASIRDVLLYEYQLPGNPVSYVTAQVVPVEDGGSSTRPQNLYPLPVKGWGGQETRALVAGEVHDEICSHETTVAQAAKLLEGDWLAKGIPDDD